MNKLDYEIFSKRYDKFKKNNLPTPFWDEERQVLEYVHFNKEYLNGDDSQNLNLEINKDLVKALGDIARTGLYYSFISKKIVYMKENGKLINKVEVGHCHAHSFEEVVRMLYDFPESFLISKEDEEFYSKQELDYLKKTQNYLLLIGLKDLETLKVPVSRYRNKKHSKYRETV